MQFTYTLNALTKFNHIQNSYNATIEIQNIRATKTSKAFLHHWISNSISHLSVHISAGNQKQLKIWLSVENQPVETRTLKIDRSNNGIVGCAKNNHKRTALSVFRFTGIYHQITTGSPHSNMMDPFLVKTKPVTIRCENNLCHHQEVNGLLNSRFTTGGCKKKKDGRFNFERNISCFEAGSTHI